MTVIISVVLYILYVIKNYCVHSPTFLPNIVTICCFCLPFFVLYFMPNVVIDTVVIVLYVVPLICDTVKYI